MCVPTIGPFILGPVFRSRACAVSAPRKTGFPVPTDLPGRVGRGHSHFWRQRANARRMIYRFWKVAGCVYATNFSNACSRPGRTSWPVVNLSWRLSGQVQEAGFPRRQTMFEAVLWICNWLGEFWLMWREFAEIEFGQWTVQEASWRMLIWVFAFWDVSGFLCR